MSPISVVFLSCIFYTRCCWQYSGYLHYRAVACRHEIKAEQTISHSRFARR